MSGLGSATVTRPVWLQEIDTTLAVTSQYVLWGNVNDLHLVPGDTGSPLLLTTTQALWDVLRQAGFGFLLVHDPVDGLSVLPPTPEAAQAATGVLSASHLVIEPDRATPVTVGLLGETLRAVTSASGVRCALALTRTGRLATDVSRLEPALQAFFALAEKVAATSAPRPVAGAERVVPNSVFWLLDREQDLPAWLVADNEEVVRTVVVPLPDREERYTVATLLVPSLPSPTPLTGTPAQEAAEELADRCEGSSLREVMAVAGLARDRGVPAGDLEAAVRAYRVGAADNPWRKDYLRERVVEAEGPEGIHRRVMGQPAAVTKALDILKRTVLGLSGAQARSSGNRPRGVMLLVGPTGTGKTELAKALTEIVFGPGAVPLRFDMSEFGADHSEARLMGAPPGYVGYDAGGELTNSVRRNPFSLVLFDEIDKAHPRILDKFLQVLDEGRLTDGRGATVSFQETLLVFTSNAGMDAVTSEVVAAGGGVDALPPFPELAARLGKAIDDHFTLTLRRPELLNRFGDNIVVFDFIRSPHDRAIFDGLLKHVTARVAAELGADLVIDARVRDDLAAACLVDPLMGGRGIGNLVESMLVNPLARALFAATTAPDGSPGEARALRVTAWSMTDGVAQVRLVPQ